MCRGLVEIMTPEGQLLARQQMGRMVLPGRDLKITVWGGTNPMVRFMDFYAQLGECPVGLTASLRLQPPRYLQGARCQVRPSLTRACLCGA